MRRNELFEKKVDSNLLRPGVWVREIEETVEGHAKSLTSKGKKVYQDEDGKKYAILIKPFELYKAYEVKSNDEEWNEVVEYNLDDTNIIFIEFSDEEKKDIINTISYISHKVALG